LTLRPYHVDNTKWHLGCFHDNPDDIRRNPAVIHRVAVNSTIGKGDTGLRVAARRLLRSCSALIATFCGGTMFRPKPIQALAFLVVVAACNDAVSTSSPDLASASARGTGGAVATVRMMDACDPTTFAGVPGGCQRSGGVTFEQFISQVSRLGRAPAWQFAPEDLYLHEGDEFMATNVGGEVHTFTEVEEFGGGIVAALNNLTGLTTVAPECQTLGQSDFVPPGESTPAEETDEVGDEHYQCCIHPWMRTTVHVREG
jgi:plastocyanin